MRIITFIAAFFLGVWSVGALAHEGEDHDAPTTLKAPKGGVIKALDVSRVEVVTKGKDLRVYVYDQELKPAQAARFTIVASAKLPRVKTEHAISLTARDTFFEGSYDAKGMHRYTLKLVVTDSSVSRTETLTFTVEPKR